MKKWILLIGLFTYTSVGWSETLMMKCFRDLELSDGTRTVSKGMYKLETEEKENSSTLLTQRDKGNWTNICEGIKRPSELVGFIRGNIEGCKKGDLSVLVKSNEENVLHETVFDFLEKIITIYRGDILPTMTFRCKDVKWPDKRIHGSRSPKHCE